MKLGGYVMEYALEGRRRGQYPFTEQREGCACTSGMHTMQLRQNTLEADSIPFNFKEPAAKVDEDSQPFESCCWCSSLVQVTGTAVAVDGSVIYNNCRKDGKIKMRLRLY